MIKTYLDSNIFIIEDFITEEERVSILDNTWINGKEEIKSRISLLFNDTLLVSGTAGVRELLSGEFTDPHSDQHKNGCECGYCINNHNTFFMYGVVLYLNDDFTGGELKYTKKSIVHKPKAKSLVCHPASEEYEHEVLEVKSGTRKFISFFLEEKH
jgi:hypothetical protein